MRCVVNAQKLLDWLLSEGDIQRREEGVALGQEFFATGIIRHGETWGRGWPSYVWGRGRSL